MADLQVVYDPTIEVAAIVDLDRNMSWGPMCPGPQGGSLLQAFIDGMPFDITILSSEQARDIFLQVFQEDAAKSAAAATSGDSSPVEPAGTVTSSDTALATADAVANAGAPPAPAPADADMAADQSQTATVSDPPTQAATESATLPVGETVPEGGTTTTNCLVCNPQGTGSNNPACVVCGGTGQVQAA